MSLPVERLPVVDVLENIDGRDRVLRKISHTVAERIFRRPPHLPERIDEAGAAAQTDCPKPAICCRAKYHIMVTQASESARHYIDANARNVTPNDQHRSRR